MALIKCEECGHMISDKASECPNCGAPPMERKFDASVVKENGNNVKESKKAKSAQSKYIIGAGILVVLAIIGYFICTHLFGKVDDNSQKQLPESENTNIINGHGYVDLGLSVKWATCNVGANTPEEYMVIISHGVQQGQRQPTHLKFVLHTIKISVTSQAIPTMM